MANPISWMRAAHDSQSRSAPPSCQAFATWSNRASAVFSTRCACRAVDRVALRQRLDARRARIAMFGAADHVVQQAFAHRRFADAHHFQIERGEARFENGRTARNYRCALFGETRQVDLVDVAEIDQRIAQLFHRRRGDAGVAPVRFLQDAADRADRARRTDRFAPADGAVIRGELLQFDGDFGLRLFPAFRADLAVLEEAQRAGHAAHLQAFFFERVEMLADDEFRAAAADVDDQAPFRRIRHAVRDAEVDQARFLAAGDDFDRMTQFLFGVAQERRGRAQAPHGIRRHRAHAMRRQGAQTLSKPRQGLQRAVAARFLETAVRTQAGGQTHAVAQAVDHARFAVFVAGDDEMEAVRSEIDGRHQFAFADFGIGAVGHGKTLGTDDPPIVARDYGRA